jgi:hypothetical protein
VPIANGQITPAPPFHYLGSSQDHAAALACLSLAVLYEAGDDPPGERAVAQVVLNRLRHPTFPKTVCGVVFEGAERKTGCQFTFTCDGSLARQQSAAALQRATTIAEAALSGHVYKPVGTATHYHTDWVVPYWRSSLEKIAVVHTQIFYRWPGAWGSRSALIGRLQSGERPTDAVVRLAGLNRAPDSPLVIEQAALPIPGALAVAGVPQAALKGNINRLKDEFAGQFVLQLDPGAPSASYAIAGYNLCGEKLECTVFGWTDARTFPQPPDLAVDDALARLRVSEEQYAWDRAGVLGMSALPTSFGGAMPRELAANQSRWRTGGQLVANPLPDLIRPAVQHLGPDACARHTGQLHGAASRDARRCVRFWQPGRSTVRSTMATSQAHRVTNVGSRYAKDAKGRLIAPIGLRRSQRAARGCCRCSHDRRRLARQ